MRQFKSTSFIHFYKYPLYFFHHVTPLIDNTAILICIFHKIKRIYYSLTLIMVHSFIIVSQYLHFNQFLIIIKHHLNYQ
jgi:hypothetical protein